MRAAPLLSLLGLACAPAPPPSGACEPRSGGYLVSEECAFDRWSGDCWMACVGPPGCGDEVEFHWRRRDPVLFREWCTCDGLTDHSFDGSPEPTARWRWWGSCEDPCERVEFIEGAWGWSHIDDIDIERESFNPACTACREARYNAAGDCLAPDGLRLAAACCDCRGASLAADGSCRAGSDPRLEVAAYCCDCDGASLDAWGACVFREDPEVVIARLCCE